MFFFQFQKIKLKIYQVVQNLGLLLLGLLFGIFISAYLLSGDIYDYRDTLTKQQISLPDADAIICLAGGRGRINAAEELWFRYQENKIFPILYLSGMGSQATWTGVLKQFREKTQKVIHSENVIIERESSNTEENALWFSQYAQQKGWKRVVLVTSSYHMKRSLMIFKRILEKRKIPLQIETYSVHQDLFSITSWKKDWVGLRVTMLEYLKWVYYKTVWEPA